jgi:pilus assembly protein CpaE
MAQGAQFIVLNAEEGYAKELRAVLLSVPGVKIVAEVVEPALLRQAVGRITADVVLVNLDPSPDAVLPLTSEIVASRPELPIFAVAHSTDGQFILRVMRAGHREYFPKPIDAAALTDAIDRVVANRVDRSTRGRLIAVTASCGGMGCTFVAVNLAVELAQIAPGRVALVDLDLRYGQVATLLDVDAPFSIADLCHSPEQLEQQVIERALVKHATGVHVLCRPSQMQQAETITGSACVGLLSSLLQYNEYVVTDGPTRFDIGGQAVLDLCDIQLAVVQQLVPCVRGALRTIEAMKEAGMNMDRVRLVCNRVGRESSHLPLNDVLDTIGVRKEFALIPDDWATVSGAINLGEPLLTYGPKSKVRASIAEMAQRLHNPLSDSDEKSTAKKGLITRIFAGAS